MKERKHGSTLHILHSAGNFKYVLIGEGLAAGLCAGLIAVLYRIILGYAEDFVVAAVAFIRTDWTHIVLWFAFLLILGFLVAQLLKAEPLISGSEFRRWKEKSCPLSTSSGRVCCLRR
ncbi:MAG: hypothetical protein ACLTDX_24465 [[Clostridium] innocuum]